MSATAHDLALIEECAAAVIQPEAMLSTRERLKELRGEIAQLTAARMRDVKRGKKSVNHIRKRAGDGQKGARHGSHPFGSLATQAAGA